MSLDERAITLAIAILERMDKFTLSDKANFALAMGTCPCLCARTMKEVIMPLMIEEGIREGRIQFKGIHKT